MLLVAILLFCKIIDNIELKNLQEDANVQHKIADDVTKVENSLNEGKIFDVSSEHLPQQTGDLPPLVPFEFPTDFYEKQGRKIIEAVEGKLSTFFGASNANKLKDFHSAEEMLEYISNMDFNNWIVNYIVGKCVTYFKPVEKLSVEGVANKKACRLACKQTFSTSISFVHKVLQSLISQVTDEDLRFAIFQNPKKCFKYSFDPEKNQHSCKCVDKGCQVKVSPRLMEIVNNKFINSKGPDLAEQLKQENTIEISKTESIFSLRKLGNLALYFSGFSPKKSRDRGYYGGYGYGYQTPYRKDPVDFITTHILLSIFLFIFCHCIWYFHLIYFIVMLFLLYIF